MGGIAYMERDRWLPAVKGLFGGASDSEMAGTGSSDNLVNYMSATGTIQPSAGILNATWTITPFGGSSNWNAWFDWSAQCTQTSGGTVLSATGSTYIGSIGPSGTGTNSITICGTGTRLSFVQFALRWRYFGSDYSSRTRAIGEAVDDDKVSQTSTMRCVKPDGTYGTVTRTQTGQPGQILVPSCSTEFPGSTPDKLTVTGGRAGAESPVATYDFTNPRTQYPDCFDSAGAFKATCTVRVWINGVPCVNGMAGCYDPEQWKQDNPSGQYECRWGSYVIPWERCAPLRHHYGTTPDTQVKTVTTTNPKTGLPETRPDGDPEVKAENPATSPGTGLFPGTGTNPLTPSTKPDVTSDPDSQNCYGAAWSWNPVDWVVVPVKCVLKWAFVPRPETLQTEGLALKAKLDTSVVGTWAHAFGDAVPEPPAEDTSCQGPTFTVNIMHKVSSFQPFNSCSEPMHTVALVSKALLSLVMASTLVFAAIRILGAGFGWAPFTGNSGAAT